jgi:hypothetical protein
MPVVPRHIVVLLLFLVCGVASAKKERPYADEWAAANGGRVEKKLPDGDRADVLTKTHAIEVEFAPAWKEALGQSLSYAFITNKRAGIVLIIRDKKERSFLLRLTSVILHYRLPIDVWQTGAGSDITAVQPFHFPALLQPDS